MERNPHSHDMIFWHKTALASFKIILSLHAAPTSITFAHRWHFDCVVSCDNQPWLWRLSARYANNSTLRQVLRYFFNNSCMLLHPRSMRLRLQTLLTQPYRLTPIVFNRHPSDFAYDWCKECKHRRMHQLLSPTKWRNRNDNHYYPNAIFFLNGITPNVPPQVAETETFLLTDFSLDD